MTTRQSSRRVRALLEPGGWLAVRHGKAELAGAAAERLLAGGAALGGNLRYVRTAIGTELRGEAPVDCDSGNVEQARRRLQSWLQFQRPGAGGRQTLAAPDDEQVETALAEAGFAFARRDEAWIVPTSSGQACEIVVRTLPGGALVYAAFPPAAESGEEELETTSSAAVQEYLCRAQGGLRFARCELEGSALRIASRAEVEFLESDMRHAVCAVATACELLLPQIRALRAEPALARAYLRAVRDAPPDEVSEER